MYSHRYHVFTELGRDIIMSNYSSLKASRHVSGLEEMLVYFNA
jgi:hypothetical protein